MDFSLSPKAQDYIQRISTFMQQQVLPAEPEYSAQVQNVPDWRSWKQPAVMETLKAKARAAGLWNLFLPDRKYGAGLTNVEYAPLFLTATLLTPATWKCS
jgi:acyl-CoA dehydrogenase